MNFFAVIGVLAVAGVAFVGGYTVNLKELVKLKKSNMSKDRVLFKQNNIIKMKNSKFSEISEHAKQNDLGNAQAKMRKINELAQDGIKY